MANRDEIVFLEDILECIQKIENYIENISETEFQNDSEKQDAIIRRIEIIGEATKKISNQTRENYPQVPWKEMAGMRDVVVHGYFGISIRLIWNVATNEIRNLKPEMEKILQDKLNSSNSTEF